MELDIIAVLPLRGEHRLGKDGDHQLAPPAALVVKGAQLAIHCQPPALQWQQRLELVPGGDDMQNVGLAGQPLDREGEAVEPLAVVFMGHLGLTGRCPPQPDIVACFLHMYVHLIRSPDPQGRLTVQTMRRLPGL